MLRALTEHKARGLFKGISTWRAPCRGMTTSLCVSLWVSAWNFYL